MNSNKKLLISLGMTILMSIASPIKLHGMQEGWQNLVPELREKIIGLNPDLQQAINFLAWRPHHTLKGYDRSVRPVTAADGMIIVTRSGDETARVWDRKNYKEIATLKGHNDFISSVAIADGIIVTGSEDKTAKVWDKNNYKELATLKGHNGAVYSVAVADGIIVTVSYDETAKVWDKNNYKEITTLKGHNHIVYSVAVADGIIVTGSGDKTAKVWDRNNYKEITTLKGHNDLIWSVAIADGIIVTGSGDKTAKVWDRNNYKELATLEGHTGLVYSVAIADGIIVTGSADKTAKVWDRNNYKEITTLKGHNDLIWSVAVAVAVADGIIVTGSTSFVRVWDSKPFAGTAETNPLMWILSHATIQQLDFIKRVCEATKDRSDLIIALPQKLGEIQEGESQEQRDGRTYFSFPEAVRQYLRDRLKIRKDEGDETAKVSDSKPFVETVESNPSQSNTTCILQ